MRQAGVGRGVMRGDPGPRVPGAVHWWRAGCGDTVRLKPNREQLCERLSRGGSMLKRSTADSSLINSRSRTAPGLREDSTVLPSFLPGSDALVGFSRLRQETTWLIVIIIFHRYGL